MFKYSSDATICFAVLSDLASESSDGSREWDLSICRGFYRGGTLQELLAPSNIVFYDQVFQRVGDKYSLIDEISRITSIPAVYLIESGRFQAPRIAQRMSWASKRQTTRLEDMAYCLLSIFLYGEGRKAFIRLQEHIIAQSDDETILAWTSSTDPDLRGMLAEEPSEFSEGSELRRGRWVSRRPSYSFSNRGLEFGILPIVGESLRAYTQLWPASSMKMRLDCTYHETDEESWSSQFGPNGPKEVCIWLLRIDHQGSYIWYRASSEFILARCNELKRLSGHILGGYSTICLDRSRTTSWRK